jgi:uncharacterized protein YbcI
VTVASTASSEAYLANRHLANGALPLSNIGLPFVAGFGALSYRGGEQDGCAGSARASPDAERDLTEPLKGGHLLAAISTTIVGILREHYGRGPMKAKTYALDDIIVCVMRGSGFTALEKTMMDSGDPDRVVAMRHDFQRLMAARYTGAIEELTGRKVVAFLSQAHVEPDITMEIFFIDAPLDGFGAVEVIDPE